MAPAGEPAGFDANPMEVRIVGLCRRGSVLCNRFICNV